MALVTEAQAGSTLPAATPAEPTSQERIQKGLVSMLDSDNPLLAGARKRGGRMAAGRGLGTSSYGARAAEGAAMEYATPIAIEGERLDAARRAQKADITSREGMQTEDISARERLQTQELDVRQSMQQEDSLLQKYLQGQQLTAQEELQLRDIESREGMQATEIAARAELQQEDSLLQKYLQGQQLTAQEELQLRDIESREGMQATDVAAKREFQAVEGVLQKYLQGQQLTSQEDQQLRDIEMRTGMQATDIAMQQGMQNQQLEFQERIKQQELAAQQAMQMTDIEYKQWLEEATFGHQKLLEGNRQASDAYRSFMDVIGQVYTNPDTSSSQKSAAVRAMKDTFSKSLEMLEVTTDIDLSGYLGPKSINYVKSPGEEPETPPLAPGPLAPPDLGDEEYE